MRVRMRGFLDGFFRFFARFQFLAQQSTHEYVENRNEQQTEERGEQRAHARMQPHPVHAVHEAHRQERVSTELEELVDERLDLEECELALETLDIEELLALDISGPSAGIALRTLTEAAPGTVSTTLVDSDLAIISNRRLLKNSLRALLNQLSVVLKECR